MDGMPAVILAAGEGKRLTLACGMPKPLTKLLGLSLLERAVLTCKRAGVQEFYVVVGHAKEQVTNHAGEVARRCGVKVKVVENPEWPEGNGTSVLAVSRVLNSPFLLQMVDHIFEPEIVRKFLKRVAGSTKTVLAVDPRTNQILDLEDATKVKLVDGEISAIGKELTDFNAVDMGLFYCTPEIFEALREARINGAGNLVDGVRWLSERGRIAATVIEEGEWFDIDRPEVLKEAENRLLAKLQKAEDGLISKNLNRKISIEISRKLAPTKISPGTITLLSFLIALLGALLFLPGAYLTTLAAGIVIQLSSILDGCDGELARMRLESSPRGGWLDTVLDRYADATIVLAVTYQCWMVNPTPWIWAGGMFALLGFLAVSYAKKEFALRMGRGVKEDFWEKLTKRDTRLFAIFCGAILNVPFLLMMTVAILSHLWILWFILEEFGKTRLRGEHL
jgi:CDP-L-myo-inositol myo-inositolphosphotransferase